MEGSPFSDYDYFIDLKPANIMVTEDEHEAGGDRALPLRYLDSYRGLAENYFS